MSNDIHCYKCGFRTGKSNQPNGTFLCSGCKIEYDWVDEKAEAKYMGVE